MAELQGGTGGLTEFLRQNRRSSPSMESWSTPGTYNGKVLTQSREGDKEGSRILIIFLEVQQDKTTHQPPTPIHEQLQWVYVSLEWCKLVIAFETGYESSSWLKSISPV